MFSSRCSNLLRTSEPLTHMPLRSLPPLIITLVPGQSRSLDQLKAMRVQVTNELVEVVNEFGPKIYDDFHEVCVFRGSTFRYSDWESSAACSYHQSVVRVCHVAEAVARQHGLKAPCSSIPWYALPVVESPETPR